MTLINNVKPTANKVKTVCGPGTGMGTCMLYPAKVGGEYQYQVMPAEGGHSLFSPTSELEMEFLSFLEYAIAFP